MLIQNLSMRYLIPRAHDDKILISLFLNLNLLNRLTYHTEI